MKKLSLKDFQKAEELIEIYYTSLTFRFSVLNDFLLVFSKTEHRLPTYVDESIWVIKNSLVHGIALDLLRMFDPSYFRDNFDLSNFIYSIDENTPLVPAPIFEEMKKDLPGYLDIRDEARKNILEGKNGFFLTVEKIKEELKPFRDKSFSHADLKKFGEVELPLKTVTEALIFFNEFVERYFLGWKNRSLEADFSSQKRRFRQAGEEVKVRLKW